MVMRALWWGAKTCPHGEISLSKNPIKAECLTKKMVDGETLWAGGDIRNKVQSALTQGSCSWL